MAISYTDVISKNRLGIPNWKTAVCNIISK